MGVAVCHLQTASTIRCHSEDRRAETRVACETKAVMENISACVLKFAGSAELSFKHTCVYLFLDLFTKFFTRSW